MITIIIPIITITIIIIIITLIILLTLIIILLIITLIILVICVSESCRVCVYIYGLPLVLSFRGLGFDQETIRNTKKH